MVKTIESRDFKRGDVWYIRFGEEIGSEQTAGRPGLIISSDIGNKTSQTCVMALLTTQPRSLSIYPTVITRGKRSWVLCNQIKTVDKSRLTDYMKTLTDSELASVDRALAEALGLPAGSNEAEALKKEKVEIEEKLHTYELEKLALTVERDMYKRQYEVAIERFAGERLVRDIGERVEEKSTAPVVKKEESTAEEENTAEEESTLVDINRCGEAELRGLGFDARTVQNIIAGRPYYSVDAVLMIAGVTRIAFQLVKNRITVGDTAEFKKKPAPKPVEPKVKQAPKPQGKVDINTCKAVELMEIVGMSRTLAYTITGYRKKNGPFRAVEDLLNVPNFGTIRLKRYGGKLEVREETLHGETV